MTRNIFYPGNHATIVDFALMVLRLAVGILMLTHGLGKFPRLFGEGPIQFSDPIGIGATASLILAIFSEVLCSILLIFGLGTRLAVVPLLITMLVAALIHHTDDPFRKQELPLLYASIFFFIGLTGAGKISIDQWTYNRLNRQKN